VSPSSPLSEISPVALFGQVDDPAWRWLHLEAREQCPFLADYLPSLPPESLQTGFTGASERDGLTTGIDTYEIFKELVRAHRRPLEPGDTVLDFGCGWGRIIRFFLRDIEPANLWGIDVSEKRIKACLETNHWCRFEQSTPEPPSRFEDEMFDLVYSYSVFSHLSEELHLSWLAEFERILKPDGILLSTTLPRQFIKQSGEFALTDQDSLAPWQRQAARAFSDPEELLDAYDRGAYCFGPIDGAGEHFGFACIPKSYVSKQWTRHFVVHDLFMDPRLTQEIIVCQRR
jgi:2-polyprenyl-3-methyl-5-hydroxy-6-metoxy-1,4-benzoquinol methylase